MLVPVGAAVENKWRAIGSTLRSPRAGTFAKNGSEYTAHVTLVGKSALDRDSNQRQIR